LSLIITLVLTIIGAMFKITHWANGNNLISAALIASLGYVILGIRDVFSNQKSNLFVKLIWLTGFIFVSWITGLIYYPIFKKVI
jgi:small basic protein